MLWRPQFSTYDLHFWCEHGSGEYLGQVRRSAKFDLPFDLKWPKIGHFGQFYIVYCTVLAFTTHFLYNVIQYNCPTIVTQILISGSKVKVILRSKRSKKLFLLIFSSYRLPLFKICFDLKFEFSEGQGRRSRTV